MKGTSHGARYLQHLADLGFVAVLLVAPLFMGGRHPLGRMVLACLVAGTGIAWALGRCLENEIRWSWSGAEILMLLAVGLVVVQLAPLPPTVALRLCPSLSDLLPLWCGEGEGVGPWGSWNRLSLYPQATREGLCQLLVYCVLFVVVFQRLRTQADIERLLRLMAFVTMVMAAIGFLQYLFGNGRFLWCYAHPSRDTYDAVKGPFANQNHFAHFLALGLGPLCWWLHQSLTSPPVRRNELAPWSTSHHRLTLQSIWLTGGLILTATAILLSFSRGSLIATSCGIAFWIATHARYGYLDKRWGLLLTTGLTVVGVAVWIHGHSHLEERVATIASGSLDRIDASGGRRRIWQAALRAVPDFPLIGSGVGTHREVYPRYYPHWSDVEYTHAENGFLQVLLETGLMGLALLLAGWGLIGVWLYRSFRPPSCRARITCAATLAASLLISVVHSLVDFVWFIPACASAAVILIAALARLSQPDLGSNDRSSMSTRRVAPRPAAIFAAIVGLLAVNWIRVLEGPARAAPHWDDYLSMSLAAEVPAGSGRRIGRQLQWDEVDLSQEQTLAALSALLQQCLRENPNDARAHLRYATIRLREFELRQASSENAMSLADIREAARAAGFPTREAQNRWLAAAVGPNRSSLAQAWNAAIEAVRCCPLQGQAYLHLADLAFLDLPGTGWEKALLGQAERVRPYDGKVLFCLGRQAILEGDQEAGMRSWREAFRRDPDIQDQIVQTLAAQTPPAAFVAIFQPQESGLRKLFEFYRRRDFAPQAHEVGLLYAHALERQAVAQQGAEAARHWDAIQQVYGDLDQLPDAVRAATQAVQAQPADYRLHFLLGVRLWQCERWDEALGEFRWCLNRRPNDPEVLRKVSEIQHRLRTDRDQASAERVRHPNIH